MFHEQLRIFTVQRHPINRRLVFVFLLNDAEEFVGTQPKRFPDKIIFARDAHRLVSAEIAFSIAGCGPSQFLRSCSEPQSTSISSVLPSGETLSRSPLFMLASVRIFESSHFFRMFPSKSTW